MSIDHEDTFGEIENSAEYYHELVQLLTELVKLQLWIRKTGRRLVIFFEGPDTAGKGGAI